MAIKHDTAQAKADEPELARRIEGLPFEEAGAILKTAVRDNLAIAVTPTVRKWMIDNRLLVEASIGNKRNT